MLIVTQLFCFFFLIFRCRSISKFCCLPRNINMHYIVCSKTKKKQFINANFGCSFVYWYNSKLYHDCLYYWSWYLILDSKWNIFTSVKKYIRVIHTHMSYIHLLNILGQHKGYAGLTTLPSAPHANFLWRWFIPHFFSSFLVSFLASFLRLF